LLNKPKCMRVNVEGQLASGVVAKDIILYIIAQLGVGGGTGYFVEYAGSTIRNLSMEGRMTVCNMSIEMGARGGLIAPDQTTFDYLKGKEYAPKGDQWEKATKYWTSLHSDQDALFDQEYTFRAEDIQPMITYGTHPGMGMGVNDHVPEKAAKGESEDSFHKSLTYMNIDTGQSMLGKAIDQVFIGSCTNARIEDLRLAASYAKDKKVAPTVRAMVVPGSQRVAKQAIEEGLEQIFTDAGFEFREAGCSACLSMNEDKVLPGKYCVSTSNRNFEGRQGPGARTILASPLTAAAAAIAGRIVDVRGE